MPIYAYRCASCGHALDVLQKLSDPVLTVCPSCGEPALRKQLTAAGFQLKGSGWYATDFRGGNSAAAAKPEGEAGKEGGDKPATGDKPAADAGTPAAPAKPAAAAPAAAPAAGGSTPAAGSTPST